MKCFKLYLTLVFILGFSLRSHCEHLVGGDISYKFIKTQTNGDRQYLIKVTVIRDLVKSTTDFDDEIEVGVYFKDDNQNRYMVLDMSLTKKRNIIPNCIDTSLLRFQEGEYEKLVDLPRSEGGYQLTWERCCRTLSKNLENTSGEADVPVYLICHIPDSVVNTSAQFHNFVSGFCVGKSSLSGTSHFDEDGDSIVVSLVNPIKGSASNDPQQRKPRPTTTFTLSKPIPFNTGYHYLAPFGDDSQNLISIDSNNVLKATIVEPGTYYLAYKISEYRNHKLVTSRIVDVSAISFSCMNNTTTNHPTNLTPKYLGHFKGRLDWSTCENQVSHYVVYRREQNQPNFDSIGYVLPSNNFYVDSTISSPGLYYYYVKGVGLPGKDSGKSNEVFLRFNNLKINHPASHNIHIFPNPTTTFLTIESDQSIANIQLYDVCGVHKQVDVSAISQSKINIDTETLPSGS